MKETLKRNPEESYKEYLTRVAAYIALLMQIPQELRIRSRGTERHSASNCAKLNRLISYHRLLCDPCQEIQDDMPWMSFGLSRHLRRWNPQKADTIRILESVR